MERFLNIVHYILYKVDYKMHLFSNKINPILKLYKLPYFKRHFEKKGYDPEEMLNKIYEDKETGFSSIFSGGVTIGIMGIIFMGIINIISGLFKLDLDFLPPLLYFIIIFLPAYYATHMLVFRKDKYVKYFYEFEKKSRIWKRSWAWISLAFLITSIAFFYASMVIRGHLVHS